MKQLNNALIFGINYGGSVWRGKEGSLYAEYPSESMLSVSSLRLRAIFWTADFCGFWCTVLSVVVVVVVLRGWVPHDAMHVSTAIVVMMRVGIDTAQVKILFLILKTGFSGSCRCPPKHRASNRKARETGYQ